MVTRIRLLAPHDSHLLSAGITRVYGQTYPNPEFYDSLYLRSAIESGKLHCVVATDARGDVVACMSTVLEVRGDFTADGSALMVAPEHRGQGIVARLGHEMVETYARLGLGGLHLYALALHDRVQNQSLASGAVVTGVLPAWFSQRAKVSGYDHPHARIGAVTLYMPLGELPARTCYLPQRYAPVLSDIYQQLRLQRNFLDAAPSSLQSAMSVFEVEDKPANHQRRVLLQRVGGDCSSILQQQLAELRSQQGEVIYLDIPLSDPAGHFAVEEARALGFFFGALMVDRRGSDHLRLQYYETQRAAPEHMIIASPEAQALLEFVLNDREVA